METGWLGSFCAPAPQQTSRQKLSAIWRACARFMCGRNTVKRSPDSRQAKLSAPTSDSRIAAPQRAMTRSPSEKPARSLIRCRRSMSPYSMETMAPGAASRSQLSTRFLNPSHDNRPVKRVQILRGAARQQAREAAEPAHGDFVEARFVGAIEDDQRAGGAAARDAAARATSLQAIWPPLTCLSLLVAMGLRVSMQRRASSSPTMASCSRANAVVELPSDPRPRAIPRAERQRPRRYIPGAGKPHAKHFRCSARARPESSDLISADFTVSPLLFFF